MALYLFKTYPASEHYVTACMPMVLNCVMISHGVPFDDDDDFFSNLDVNLTLIIGRMAKNVKYLVFI